MPAMAPVRCWRGKHGSCCHGIRWNGIQALSISSICRSMRSNRASTRSLKEHPAEHVPRGQSLSAGYFPRLIIRARNSAGVGPFWGLRVSFRYRWFMAWAKVRLASAWSARS